VLALLIDGVEMGVRCHNIHNTFHEDWFRHSEVVRGDRHRQLGDLISIVLYFRNKKVG
jgi:hypothetical protein